MGVDGSSGGWNGPVDPATNEFVYVPIPETQEIKPGLRTGFDRVEEPLAVFCRARALDLRRDLRMPHTFPGLPLHLDPDFEHLTYGDNGARRGSEIVNLSAGDLLVFFAGLRSIVDHELVYALIGC